MKFGDIILNTWAGESNPHKYGMFINKPKRGEIKLLHADGRFSNYYYRNLDKEYLIVGHINIKKQMVAFDQPNSEIVEAVEQPLTKQGSEPSEISAFIKHVSSLSLIKYGSNSELVDVIESAQKLLPC